MPTTEQANTSRQLQSMGVPSHGFDFTPTDSGNVIDPNTGNEVVVHAITPRTDGNVQVKYKDSDTPVVLPVFAGVRRSGLFTRIYATNTTVTGDVVCEY